LLYARNHFRSSHVHVSFPNLLNLDILFSSWFESKDEREYILCAFVGVCNLTVTEPSPMLVNIVFRDSDHLPRHQGVILILPKRAKRGSVFFRGMIRKDT
jgi:hypothetical protein